MPELCRFYNIVTKMIFSDTDKHHKPHFHVYYNEYEASVGVDGIRRCRTFRSAKSNR